MYIVADSVGQFAFLKHTCTHAHWFYTVFKKISTLTGDQVYNTIIGFPPPPLLTPPKKQQQQGLLIFQPIIF